MCWRPAAYTQLDPFFDNSRAATVSGAFERGGSPDSQGHRCLRGTASSTTCFAASCNGSPNLNFSGVAT